MWYTTSIFCTLLFALANTMFAETSLTLDVFTVEDGEGNNFHLSQFKNVPAVLVVNVASQCGYTDGHYRELQALRSEYPEDKLAILAFPCNQFGAQEPGTWEEIVNFADRQYGVTFPIMGKVDVNGHQSEPLFAWLKAASGNPVDVPWNFSKFLVTCGNVVKRYGHETSVMKIEDEIKKAMGSKCSNLEPEL